MSVDWEEGGPQVRSGNVAKWFDVPVFIGHYIRPRSWVCGYAAEARDVHVFTAFVQALEEAE